jgi:FGGY-family pentulose kinase
MTANPEECYYIGIDVGTGSARAGIFNGNGRMAASKTHPIRMWKPQPDFVQQSSGDIWNACCICVKQALAEAGLKAEQIRGIGFDATCSLTVLDENDKPVTVSPTNEDEQNVIVWMDHRAIGEAGEINQTKHEVLKYVGGVVSPEMQTPKLLWLKRNLPESWKHAAIFLDLPDFLVYRATGIDVRSLCTTVCKWTYLGHEKEKFEGSVGCWDDSYFKQVGLGDLVEEGYKRIGTKVRPMGEPVGGGLTEKAAKEMGLSPGTPSGVAIIDAHAGGIGLLGMKLEAESAVLGTPFGGHLTVEPDAETLQKRLCLIGGTSSCHMAISRKPAFIGGIWGPYYSAMIPGLWLTEGGQSATGSLVDHIIFSHSQAAALSVRTPKSVSPKDSLRRTPQEEKAESEKTGKTVYQLLNERLEELAEESEFPALLTKNLHVLPYFHGNRSPHANPLLVGGISGLKLSATLDDLALQYLATIQAIAYGTRHIIEEMNKNGYHIDTIIACGGGTKNPVFLREHADITDCKIVLPAEPEAVLLGAAILGAVASGDYASVMNAMAKMNQPGETIEPAGGKVKEYHNAKYKVFHRMYEDEIRYFDLMKKW